MLRCCLLFALLLCGYTRLPAQGDASPCPIRRAAAAGQNVWLLCDRGDMFISPDGGASWRHKPLRAELEQKIRSIAVFEGGRGFAVGDAGLLLATEDGAETWREVAVPVRENLTSIYFLGDLGWAAGWSGVVLHSRDGGKSWSLQQTGERQGLDSIYFLDADHGWAAGWVGTILRTADGGRTWRKAQTPPNTWSLESIWFRDAKNGWAVGFGGQILRSRDGGLSWERQAQPVASGLKWIAFDGSGRGWIAADNELLASEDGGETWKLVRSEQQTFFRQILPMQDSIWAVAQFGIFRLTGSELRLSRLHDFSTSAPPVHETLDTRRPRTQQQPRGAGAPKNSRMAR